MSERPAETPGGEAPESPGVETPLPEAVDALSAMTPRFNLLFHGFARRFFRHFDLDDATVARLRELESRGSVVYVMRYASLLDYCQFNALFVREGLRLSRFANGMRFFYYRPLWQSLRLDRPFHRRVLQTRLHDAGHRCRRKGQNTAVVLSVGE